MTLSSITCHKNPILQLKFFIFFFYLISEFPLLTQSSNSTVYEVDPNGYVAFCPCMGRFGNQADQYIGALAFAKSLNRTLILPPWVEYPSGERGPRFVSFDKYFNVDAIRRYHRRSVTMDNFMRHLAPQTWPLEKRYSFCYQSRAAQGDCAAKQGKPFGPFWDSFSIEFVRSETFGPLHYDTFSNRSLVDEWIYKYPPDSYPVLAFTGAPGAFPVQKHNLHLQQYFVFSDEIQKRAKTFINSIRATHAGPYVGIHLRNGADWRNACKLVGDAPLLFSAPQCFGYRGEQIRPTDAARAQMCFPANDDILQQVLSAVRTRAATWVHVASDHDHLLPELQHHLRGLNVKVARFPQNDPQVDLAILSTSNYFIGNCFSSFSAFVKRSRDVHQLPSSFWLLHTVKNERGKKDEL